jgi:hypothetical protein
LVIIIPRCSSCGSGAPARRCTCTPRPPGPRALTGRAALTLGRRPSQCKLPCRQLNLAHIPASTRRAVSTGLRIAPATGRTSACSMAHGTWHQRLLVAGVFAVSYVCLCLACGSSCPPSLWPSRLVDRCDGAGRLLATTRGSLTDDEGGERGGAGWRVVPQQRQPALQPAAARSSQGASQSLAGLPSSLPLVLLARRVAGSRSPIANTGRFSAGGGSFLIKLTRFAC